MAVNTIEWHRIHLDIPLSVIARDCGQGDSCVFDRNQGEIIFMWRETPVVWWPIYNIDERNMKERNIPA